MQLKFSEKYDLGSGFPWRSWPSFLREWVQREQRQSQGHLGIQVRRSQPRLRWWRRHRGERKELRWGFLHVPTERANSDSGFLWSAPRASGTSARMETRGRAHSLANQTTAPPSHPPHLVFFSHLFCNPDRSQPTRVSTCSLATCLDLPCCASCRVLPISTFSNPHPSPHPAIPPLQLTTICCKNLQEGVHSPTLLRPLACSPRITLFWQGRRTRLRQQSTFVCGSVYMYLETNFQVHKELFFSLQKPTQPHTGCQIIQIHRKYSDEYYKLLILHLK